MGSRSISKMPIHVIVSFAKVDFMGVPGLMLVVKENAVYLMVIYFVVTYPLFNLFFNAMEYILTYLHLVSENPVVAGML